jgi:hypothetical protein
LGTEHTIKASLILNTPIILGITGTWEDPHEKTPNARERPYYIWYRCMALYVYTVCNMNCVESTTTYTLQTTLKYIYYFELLFTKLLTFSLLSYKLRT